MKTLQSFRAEALAKAEQPTGPLPCPAPWCAKDEPDVEVTGYRGMEFVVCGNCGCTGPEGNSPDDAIRLWNQRAPIAGE